MKLAGGAITGGGGAVWHEASAISEQLRTNAERLREKVIEYSGEESA
jgi:hypothetical protein